MREEGREKRRMKYGGGGENACKEKTGVRRRRRCKTEKSGVCWEEQVWCRSVREGEGRGLGQVQQLEVYRRKARFKQVRWSSQSVLILLPPVSR